MTTELIDRSGEPVTIRFHESRPVGAYTVHLVDGTLAGRADFVDAPHPDADAHAERIFFHTEVDEEYGGRGLAKLLVREALADSIRRNLTVVPVCPLFASQLQELGAEYQADGGRSRQPTRTDFALLRSATRSDT